MSIFFQEAIPVSIQKYIGKPDRRVKDWIFLNSPAWGISILTSYFFILYIGGKVMENRKPLHLKLPLIVYNFCQVLLSAYICKEVIVTAYLSKYKLTCSEIDENNHYLGARMATAFWLFYLTKILDLSDTVFFVLRKKKNQLTFLHLYHHSTMIINWYAGILYLPGGQAFFAVMLNSFVHVVMYTYYMLSAFGPQMQKYLWWKKYLTQIQLTQFVVCIIHILTGYYNNCKAPIWLLLFTVAYLWTMVILFINFYLRAYRKRKPNRPKSIYTLTAEKNTFKVNPLVDYLAGGDYKIE